MIINDMKKDNIQAMRDKNTVARSIYSVVLNKIKLVEIEKRSKGEEVCDADVVKVLQKAIKELNAEAENYSKVNNVEQVEVINKQKSIIEKYMPKMMSEEEIYSVIEKMEDKSIPNVMKTFKQNFAGKCEMRLVQQVLKKF